MLQLSCVDGPVPVGAILSSLTSSQRLLQVSTDAVQLACLPVAVFQVAGQVVPGGCSGSCSAGWVNWERWCTGVWVEGTVALPRCGVQSEGVDACACVDTQDAFQGVRARVEELAGAEEQL